MAKAFHQTRARERENPVTVPIGTVDKNLTAGYPCPSLSIGVNLAQHKVLFTMPPIIKMSAVRVCSKHVTREIRMPQLGDMVSRHQGKVGAGSDKDTYE